MGKQRVGVYLSDKVIEMCDGNIERFDARNRSELIELAVIHLIASKDSEITTNIITPKLESSIRGAVQDSESHTSSLIFKLGVEVDMLSHIIAASNDIDIGMLNKLRAMCVDEVKATNGKFNFESAARLQSKNKRKDVNG